MANRKKKSKRKIVLTSGVFDLLHLGHVKFLETAKKNGGPTAELVVIVARDITVKNRKNEEPVMSENQRRALVESLSVVDVAILGFENFNIPQVIQKIKPDVIAVGFDQSNLENILVTYVKEKNLNVKIVKIGKFKEDELDSSSKIKQKIIKDFKR